MKSIFVKLLASDRDLIHLINKLKYLNQNEQKAFFVNCFIL